MPGVNVRTQTRSGPVSPLRATSGTYFAVGLAQRGPTDRPVTLRSMADYRRRFGDRVAYSALYDDLRTYFEEGGTRAIVARVVGPGASVATVSVDNRADPVEPAVRFDAASAGTWGDDVTVEVADGTRPDTVTVTVTAGEQSERRSNLADVPAIVAAFAASDLVRAVDLGAEATGADALPAVGSYDLAGGDDDRDAVDADTHIDALSLFAYELGDGAVAIPGQPADLVGAALIDHATETRRLALLATDADASPEDAVAAAAAFGSEHAGLFYPWVRVPDGAGGTRTISPEGYAAAVRSRAHEIEGPWRAPMGEIAIARYVSGVADEVNRETGDLLDAARVSAIRPIGNTVRLYGWRSLSTNEADYALLTGRDVLNHVVTRCERQLEQFVGATVDGRGQLFSTIEGELLGIVQPMAAAGGLFALIDDEGDEIDPGYAVNAGADVQDQLGENVVKALVSVRVSPTATLIDVTITKVGLLAGV